MPAPKPRVKSHRHRPKPPEKAKPKSGTSPGKSAERPGGKPATPGRKPAAPGGKPAQKSVATRTPRPSPRPVPEPNVKQAPRHPAPKAPKRKGPARPFRAGVVAIVGRPNVGKSTLLNAMLGELLTITSSKPQTTRDAIRGIVTTDDTQIVFVDTPGLHSAKTMLGDRMNQFARDAGRGSDVVLFVTDVRNDGKPELRDEDLALVKTLPQGIPVVVVLNKVDTVKDKTTLFPVLEAITKAGSFDAVVPLSARRSDGRENLIAAVREHLPEQPALFDGEELSDRPVRFFVAEFVREQILKKTHSEIPHAVAVVVERFEETKRVPHVEIAVHVDKDSHKGIVLGKGGLLMKAIGTDARRRVERMLGRKVHLKIWVRVSPEWYESAAMLREFGYVAEAEDDG
ncbi:MAG: GTPase Era [Polyangiaceae bacterium]